MRAEPHDATRQTGAAPTVAAAPAAAQALGATDRGDRRGSVLQSLESRWIEFEDILDAYPTLQHVLTVPAVLFLGRVFGVVAVFLAAVTSMLLYYHLRLLRDRRAFYETFMVYGSGAAASAAAKTSASSSAASRPTVTNKRTVAHRPPRGNGVRVQPPEENNVAESFLRRLTGHNRISAGDGASEDGHSTKTIQQTRPILLRKESCYWLNELMTNYWANSELDFHLRETLQASLDSVAKPSYIRTVLVEQVSLGSEAPPRIRAIRTRFDNDRWSSTGFCEASDFKQRSRSSDTEEDDSSQQQQQQQRAFIGTFSVEWASAATIALRLFLQRGGRGFGSVSVSVNDLSLRGDLRVEISFQGGSSMASVCFVRRPDYNFAVRPLGGIVDFASMPGISEWLHSFASLQMDEYIVWPQSWAFPLSEGNRNRSAGISNTKESFDRQITNAAFRSVVTLVEEAQDEPSSAESADLRRGLDGLNSAASSESVGMHSVASPHAEPITDILFVFTDREQTLDKGFEIIGKSVSGFAANLNAGTKGGVPVYLAVRRGGTSAPICSLRVLFRNEINPTFQIPDGFEIIGKNLNFGVKDCHCEVFVCFKRCADETDLPLTDLAVVFSDDEATPTGFSIIEANLNFGTTGLGGKKEGRPVFLACRSWAVSALSAPLRREIELRHEQSVASELDEFAQQPNAQEQDPIEDVRIIYDDQKPPANFVVISETADLLHNANLNVGNLGRRVYLCYRRQNTLKTLSSGVAKLPVVAVVVLSRTDDLPPRFEIVDGTLNKGSVGGGCFLAVRRSSRIRPIVNFCVTRGNDVIPEGFKRIDVNLNRGTPSPIAVFLSYQRASSTKSPPSDSVDEIGE